MHEENLSIDEQIVYDDFSIKIHDLALITDENYSGYIYFGRDTCPFCLEFNKILKQELKDNSQLTIYKFDTDEWRETEDFQIILDKYEIEGIPALVKVETDKKLKTFSPEENETNLQEALHNFFRETSIK